MNKKLLQVCYFGTYRENYPRNRLNINRLKEQGIEVIECHSKLWKGDRDRHNLIDGGWKRREFWIRVFKAYYNLLSQYLRIDNYDVMVVGYPGQFDIFLARLLSWIKGKPLAWDVLMSLYLIATERNLQKTNRFIVWFIQKIEKTALRLPDILLVDTPEYGKWYQSHYEVKKEKIRILPLGADDKIFNINYWSKQPEEKIFSVIYYGSFIPNHGVQIIAETAKLLSQNKDIFFELIGEGLEKEKLVKFAKLHNLRNILFTSWLDKTELVYRMSLADIILGTFGSTPQSLMTIQNKIWESLAMAKPVINGDSNAIRSIFRHLKHIYICERNNANALAESIQTLKNNPDLCRTISDGGYKLYKRRYSTDKIGQLIKSYLYELISESTEKTP